MKKKQVIFLLLFILINSLIWFQSFLPGEISGSYSGAVEGVITDALDKINIETPEKFNFGRFIRKTAHFTEFFMLGLFGILFSLTIFSYKKSFMIVFYYGIFVAIVDETIQNFIPGRGTSIIDVLIDTGGLVCAILIGMLISYIVEKRKIKKINI